MDPQTRDFEIADQSATYEISVEGLISDEWSDKLAGMKISRFQSDRLQHSTLKGQMIDQSELVGVLNTLNDYQYKIISVNKINK